MIDYTLEHIFSYNATLAPPEVIGPLPEGIRVNVYATGGEVRGPRLQGKIRPVGGDWLTVRQDGVGILDVRATIELHDGALIYITYTGVIDLGADGYQQFLQGHQCRVEPRFGWHPVSIPPMRITCGRIVSSVWALGKRFWNGQR